MTPQPEPLAAERAIRQARAAQNDAIARSDFDAAARFWTEDVTIRRALGPAVAGAEAARQVLEQAAGHRPALVYRRTTEVVCVSGHWPLAYEEGVWSARSETGAEGDEMSGRFAAQWVLRDGAWLIRSELFVALDCDGPGCDFTALP